MSDYIDIAEHNDGGFLPVVCSEGWKVALFNDHQNSRKENIKTIARHLQTDEVFILLSGKAFLYYSGSENDPQELNKQDMESYKVYKVKAGTWHVVATEAGTRLAVIENANTSAENTERCKIDPTKLQ